MKTFRDRSNDCSKRSRITPEGRIRFLVQTANWRSKRSGEPYGIALADLLPLPEICPALGIPLVYTGSGRGGWTNNSASLDRVVPSKGYVRGNVCVISMQANSIKRDASPKELMDIALYAGRMAGLR